MKITQHLALEYIRTKFKVLTTISKKNAAKKAFQLFCTPLRKTKNILPPIFHDAEPLSLSIGDILLNGWRWNHGGKRRVLLLHGFESSVTNFDRYIIPLTEKNYEVLAFDAPAHGRSGGNTITVISYKEMIKKLHQEYGPIQSFFAHSFGGLALCLAMEEINHTADYRLALIAPATETTTAINTFFKFLQLDEKVRTEFDRIIVQQTGVSPSWFSINRAMKHIAAKVLWVNDEEDKITPVSDMTQAMASKKSTVEFLITKGLGHSRIYRDDDVVERIVNFL